MSVFKVEYFLDGDYRKSVVVAYDESHVPVVLINELNIGITQELNVKKIEKVGDNLGVVLTDYR